MLKANAWPYPVLENVTYELASAVFGGRALQWKDTTRGKVVDALRLRDVGRGNLVLVAKLLTPTEDVTRLVFGDGERDRVFAGFRIFCEATKHRGFVPADEGQQTEIIVPLERIRGIATVTPMFRASRESVAATGAAVVAGAVVGIATEPVFIMVDEDWTGEQIPIDWLDFATQTPPLPEEAILHVELSGSGQIVPRAWLNKKFEPEIGTIINHAGLNSPQGIVRHVMRQFILTHVWKAALAWAIKHESDDENNENWPANRIARMWRDRFRKAGWTLPHKDELNLEILDDLSLKIQHFLKTGEELSRMKDLWNF